MRPANQQRRAGHGLVLSKLCGELEGRQQAFAAPPLKRGPLEPKLLAQVTAGLGLKASSVLAAQLLDNGPVWLGLLLDDPATVLELLPQHFIVGEHPMNIAVAGIYPKVEAPPLIARINREARAFTQTDTANTVNDTVPDLEVRAFAVPTACVASSTPSVCSGMDIYEAPIMGTLHASLAQWLMADGYMPERYIASPGVGLEQTGLAHLERDVSGQVWVGGSVV